MILILVFMLLLAGEKVNAQPTQTNSRAEEKETNSQPSVTPLDNAPARVNNAANTASPSQSQERDTKDDPFKAEQLRQGRIIVWATVCIAFFGGLSFVAALIYAIVSIKQWKSIDKQATHAGEQVGKMQAQLGAMKEQERIMGESLVQSKIAIATMQFQADIAELASDSSRESAILAQRAYVSITQGSVQALANGDVIFSLRIENTGNTFARQVKILSSVDVVKEPPTIDPTLPDLPDWANVGLIGPRSFITKFATTRQTLLTEELELVQRRERKLCCWGVIEYLDMFGKSRTTKFCFQDSPFVGQFGPYGDDNDAT
jgi:hypothetical protein